MGIAHGCLTRESLPAGVETGRETQYPSWVVGAFFGGSGKPRHMGLVVVGGLGWAALGQSSSSNKVIAVFQLICSASLSVVVDC